MHKAVRHLLVLAALTAAVLIPASAMGTSSTGSQHFTVAFNNTSSLPANVDQLVKDAGGTIVERLPEIGGIGVESSNPNFAQDIGKANTAPRHASKVDRANKLGFMDLLLDVGLVSETRTRAVEP